MGKFEDLVVKVDVPVPYMSANVDDLTAALFETGEESLDIPMLWVKSLLTPRLSSNEPQPFVVELVEFRLC